MLDCICAQMSRKMVVFKQKHRSNSTKCLVNKLKAAIFTASFSLHDVIESCVKILVVVLDRPVKFKLITLCRHMLRLAHTDSTRYIDIYRQYHTGIGLDMATYVTNSMLKRSRVGFESWCVEGFHPPPLQGY